MSRRSSSDTYAVSSYPTSPMMNGSSSPSSTAYSPDTSPGSSRRNSKLPMYLPDLYDEKNLDSARGSRGCLGWLGVRSRRARTAVAVLGLVFTGAVWSQWDPVRYGGRVIPYGQDTPSTTDDLNWLPHPTPTDGRLKTPGPTPSTAIQKWGLDLSSKDLLLNLPPWPDKPPLADDQPPLSPLGHFADQLYNYGPSTLTEHHAQLTAFIDVALPEKLRPDAHAALDGYLRTDATAHTEAWDGRKAIWQTDKDEERVNDRAVSSWRFGSAANEGWTWEMVADEKAGNLVASYLKHSRIETVWNSLPTGILRADMLRYLLLYLEGGIYTDTDTMMLKSPLHWGRGATLWRNGAGWLEASLVDRVKAGESVDVVLPPPSVVVGIEADVGEREDWFEWWPRPIVQWTMASAPHHPITLDALLRITHATAIAIDWAHEHAARIKNLNEMGEYEKSEELLKVTALKDTTNGGPLSVMNWTGPGVWTDAVLSYLRTKYGLVWTDLRKLTSPLRIGDVVILPVTGFSPGVGNFGAKEPYDSQAMVEHAFRGSWKGDPKE